MTEVTITGPGAGLIQWVYLPQGTTIVYPPNTELADLRAQLAAMTTARDLLRAECGAWREANNATDMVSHSLTDEYGKPLVKGNCGRVIDKDDVVWIRDHGTPMLYAIQEARSATDAAGAMGGAKQ